jgi:solute carrier family 39 (zinc transporter), member 1/2/3
MPIYLARTQRVHVPALVFFVAKYFGSGVIIATAFIHVCVFSLVLIFVA